MAEETQYTAKTGIAQINTANTSLTGSGTVGIVLTGASNGTLIKKIWIKATGSTSRGMIRLFVNNPSTGSVALLREIEVPEIAQASIRPTFEAVLLLNFSLKAGLQLLASTQIGNTFNIIAEALDWSYYSTSVRTDTTKFSPVFTAGAIAIANANLNGTGTLAICYTAGAAATYKGSSISTISSKGTVANTPGMLRFYVNSGTTSYLFKEVIIPAHAISGTDRSFEQVMDFGNDDFDLQAGYTIRVSTQIAQNFNVMGEGNNWSYYS